MSEDRCLYMSGFQRISVDNWREYETPGSRLRALRESVGMSMGALSRELGITVVELCATELEHKPFFSGPMLNKLSRIFKIDQCELLNEPIDSYDI